MRSVPFNKQADVTDVCLSHDGTTACLDLWYPRVAGQPQFVELGLMDVRAADDLRISYDFERDGWKIEQAQVFSWEIDDELCDPKWREVAFVRAWASKIPEPLDNDE